MFRHILIPTDGSAFSEKVMRDGIDLAKALDARITGMHVLRPAFIAPVSSELGLYDPQLQQQAEETARADGERLLDRMQSAARTAGVDFERVLRESEPVWKAIIDTAETNGCDVIMMAAHGRRGLAALILGSETNKVLTHTKIPVLVYR